MQKILSRRAIYRSSADPDDMRKLKDLARAVALGQMKAATRSVPQVARHDMPVCVGIVVPTESLFAFELALRSLAWPRSDTYGLPMQVGVHVFASHDECKRAEKDGFWLKERLFVLVPSRGLLPRGFEAVADLVAEIGAPSPRLIAGAARQCLGIRLSEAEAEEAACYPLESLSKAFRPGRKPGRALRALRHMASDARKPAAASEGPTLDDLPGMGEAADWGRQLAVDLKDWEAGRIRWEDVDRGVLLSGPPGCGKTSFATALARTCGTAIVLGSLARWQSMGHMGDLLKAMRKAFDEAMKSAPCILFVDEVDSFGDRERLAVSSNNEQYCREVINGFLECLDGAAGRAGVVVVGATNYPDALDAGIRRPGRLDRHIAIPLPDAEARARILRLHLRADVGSEGFAEAARRTEGWSGARLEQLARDARRSARGARARLDRGYPARAPFAHAAARRRAPRGCRARGRPRYRRRGSRKGHRRGHDFGRDRRRCPDRTGRQDGVRRRGVHVEDACMVPEPDRRPACGYGRRGDGVRHRFVRGWWRSGIGPVHRHYRCGDTGGFLRARGRAHLPVAAGSSPVACGAGGQPGRGASPMPAVAAERAAATELVRSIGLASGRKRATRRTSASCSESKPIQSCWARSGSGCRAR